MLSTPQSSTGSPSSVSGSSSEPEEFQLWLSDMETGAAATTELGKSRSGPRPQQPSSAEGTGAPGSTRAGAATERRPPLPATGRQPGSQPRDPPAAAPQTPPAARATTPGQRGEEGRARVRLLGTRSARSRRRHLR